MRIIIAFSILLLAGSVFAQNMENNPILKKGKIKTSHKNNAPGSWKSPEFEVVTQKKSSSIYDVEYINEDVTKLTFKHGVYLGLIGGKKFEAKGNLNSDGTLDNVFGYYSKQADLWAIPYKESIYFVNSPIKKVSFGGGLFITLVMGEEIVSQEELYDFYMPIYQAYENRIKTDKLNEKEQAYEKRLDQYSIERNKVEKVNIMWRFGDPAYNWGGIIHIGAKATFKSGFVSNFLFESTGYEGIQEDYIFEVKGAQKWLYNKKKGKHTEYLKEGASDLGGAYRYIYPIEDPSYKNQKDGIPVVLKRRSTGEVLDEYVIPFSYNKKFGYEYKFSAKKTTSEGPGEDGPDIDIKVEEIAHSVTGKPLILYTVAVDYVSAPDKTFFIKASPTTPVNIESYGADSENSYERGYPGGKAGKITVDLVGTIQRYNLTYESIKGVDKKAKKEYLAGYDPSTTTNTSSGSTTQNNTASKPTKFTIVNKTGSAIHLIDEGGNGEGTLNNGSSKTFYCDENIYQAHMKDGSWKVKGRLIASGKTNCGQTIEFK